ncbi:MAG: DUF6055 domain-containing protein [Myxococcota bacterium]
MTVGWLAALSAFTPAHGAVPARPCATLERLPAAPALRVAPALPTPTKLERDAYGLPNERTSANFAVRWGNLGGVTVAEADRLLDAMELAWAVEIDAMGHPEPLTTETYKFNVYVGDTGNGAPDGYGAGGYYYVDPQGYPMVVIANASLSDPPYADHAGYHEFYHAIQGSLDRYQYDGVSAWYWEATAEWAAIEVDADNAYNGPFVFADLLLPQLPVNAFDYPDTGALQEYYQYGAFLFPHDLGHQLGIELIRDSWLDTGRDPDPMEVLRGLTAAQGADFDELFLDHLARNAAYDYDAGPVYRANTQAYAPYYPSAHEITAEADRDGGSGRIEGADAPRRYGAAVIHLDRPRAGTLTIAIDGEAAGTRGSPASYGARLVRITGGDVAYEDVPFSGRSGELQTEVGDEDELFVTVGAWTPTWREDRWMDEGFAFDWALTLEAATTTSTTATDTGDTTTTTPDDEDPLDGVTDKLELPAGCGCSGGGGGAGWLWLGALGILRRRQR